MEKCNSCSKTFKAGNRKIGCEFCGKWYHIDCEGVSTALWKTLSETEQAHWFCKKCNEKAPDVLAIVKKSVQETEELRKELGTLKETVKNIKEGNDEEFVEVIKDIVRQVKRDEQNDEGNPEPMPPNEEVIRQYARKEVHENNDKKGRECNLVIPGIDEEKDAEEEVTEMLLYLQVTVEVDGIRRMGREKIDGKTRPVWVKLGSKKERNTVLEKAKKLKAEERWKNIYINRDMTEDERKQAYNLRRELREKRDQEEIGGGNSKFKIHQGRVIRVEATPRENTEEDGIQDEDVRPVE